MEKEKFEVSGIEDLMREHGILRRIFIIYDELILRIDKNIPFSIDVVAKASKIVREFVEDYHEKTEENYIFPLFIEDKELSKLTKILLKQHDIGRTLTDKIMKFSSNNKNQNFTELKKYLNDFNNMYRAHASREDTELFPQLHFIVTNDEYEKMSNLFEDEETEKLGKGGFEKTLDRVMKLEKELNIGNLSKFSPNNI